jgi:hypothetical protein
MCAQKGEEKGSLFFQLKSLKRQETRRSQKGYTLMRALTQAGHGRRVRVISKGSGPEALSKLTNRNGFSTVIRRREIRSRVQPLRRLADDAAPAPSPDRTSLASVELTQVQGHLESRPPQPASAVAMSGSMENILLIHDRRTPCE